jgi:predicted tellurium resistance membrane protein TerC
VITAVGMADEIIVMITAVVMAVGVMLVFAEAISRFIEHHPTMKMLALSFLILIGVMLMLEGLGKHVDKGYIYFAMAFAMMVELANLAVRRRNSRHVSPVRVAQGDDSSSQDV